MLHPTSRHDPAGLRVGDRARFPLDFRDPDSVYRHSFELVAFGGCGRRHLVVVRRLADGFTTTVTVRRFVEYAEDYRRDAPPDLSARHAKLRAIHLRQELLARTEGWRGRPCFYATVMRGREWRALAGPFATHAAARDALPEARRLARRRDARAHWYAYGTALLPDGTTAGILPAELGQPETITERAAA